MAGKTRKFAQLSPQKQRQTPAKFVKLTEHDDLNERRERTADKILKGHERAKSIVQAAVTRRMSYGTGTPTKSNVFDAGTYASPKLRMPILANFEEWMKMATDNKINAGNSWNFALIDYFHEMSLLKEGDSINFQKASVTLDGCVKIYTNRVDSVATETGKLLSGLSSGREAQAAGDDDEQVEGEEGEEDDEEGEPRKSKKKAIKTGAGTTLVKDFSAIQVKKLDMEFFVDPLFKKTSAEFDEGGAKGLLLNHLCVDREGRIIFDASDESNELDAQNQEGKDTGTADADFDVEALGLQFFPELFGGDQDNFDRLHICPFLKNFESDSAMLNIPLITNMTSSDEGNQAAVLDNIRLDAQDDDDNEFEAGLQGVVDVFDDNEHAGFGEVQEIVLPAHLPGMDGNLSYHDSSTTGFGRGLVTKSENFLDMKLDSDNMFSKFDLLMRKNWAGPSHWKISRLNHNIQATTDQTVKKPRKEKEVTVIDFYTSDGEVDEDVIFTRGGANINLPKTQWSSKSRNLLPEDKHFNSESLLRLFLKPTAKIGSRKVMIKSETDVGGDGAFVEMDENFWAKRNEDEAADVQPEGVYNADFFNDGEDMGLQGPQDEDNDDDDAFEDAKQDFALQPGEEGDFGSQLQALGRKVKPEYVNYAKAAKKVDVRVLKENIWDKLELPSFEDNIESPSKSCVGEVRKFTEIVQSLGDVYPEKALSEISTSFCFICLLHLANEKGLEIKGDESMRELTVRRDETVLSIDSV